MADYFDSETIAEMEAFVGVGADTDCWDLAEIAGQSLGLTLDEWYPRAQLPFSEPEGEAKTDQIVAALCDCEDEPPHEAIVKLVVRVNSFVQINSTQALGMYPLNPDAPIVRRYKILKIKNAIGVSNMGPMKLCHFHKKD